MSNEIQLRGICQCCGREQAVMRSGTMSKHGYTVDHGYFNGVCVGQNYKPMQQDRAQADLRIAAVLEQAAKHAQRAADLEAGKIHPTEVKPRFALSSSVKMIAWADADKWDREAAVQTAIRCEQRAAEWGKKFAAELTALADLYHGTELKVVQKQAAEPVRIGDKRKADNGTVITAVRIERARVYWTREDGRPGARHHGWTGTAAWRRMDKA